MRQILEQLHRPQIGVEAELLAQPQQGRPLGAFLLGHRSIAVGQTHRSEENGIGVAAQLEGGIRQGLARGVNPGPTDRSLDDLERYAKTRRDRAQHLEGFAHDFRTNTIASQGGDFKRQFAHKGAEP